MRVIADVQQDNRAIHKLAEVLQYPRNSFQDLKECLEDEFHTNQAIIFESILDEGKEDEVFFKIYNEFLQKKINSVIFSEMAVYEASTDGLAYLVSSSDYHFSDGARLRNLPAQFREPRLRVSSESRKAQDQSHSD